MNKIPEYQTVQFNEEDWTRIDSYFQAYTGVDPTNIPSKYVNYISPTRKIMQEEADVGVKYGWVKVKGKTEKEIILEDGQKLTSEIISKAYKDAEQIFFFVSSVRNIEQLLAAHPETMEHFFLEYWAVSLLGVVKEKIKKRLDEELSGSGWKRTSVWSPGQSQFSLNNQTVLFEVLKPEPEGIYLDAHMRMIPLKSVSGTIGIVPEDAQINMISCDYCSHAKTCPGYNGTKFKNEKNRRLT